MGSSARQDIKTEFEEIVGFSLELATVQGW